MSDLNEITGITRVPDGAIIVSRGGDIYVVPKTHSITELDDLLVTMPDAQKRERAQDGVIGLSEFPPRKRPAREPEIVDIISLDGEEDVTDEIPPRKKNKGKRKVQDTEDDPVSISSASDSLDMAPTVALSERTQLSQSQMNTNGASTSGVHNTHVSAYTDPPPSWLTTENLPKTKMELVERMCILTAYWAQCSSVVIREHDSEETKMIKRVINGTGAPSNSTTRMHYFMSNTQNADMAREYMRWVGMYAIKHAMYDGKRLEIAKDADSQFQKLHSKYQFTLISDRRYTLDRHGYDDPAVFYDELLGFMEDGHPIIQITYPDL